ncbi:MULTISPECIES: AMP-binding protein [Ramlibacter]|uniref:AMP-binding protein n=1 Tax=Ramlibacter TaxID=174951 RepID=UPI0012FA58CF|nr:AMP-binding protein [Ramlibacter sp. CGMCC 1.13660]
MSRLDDAWGAAATFAYVPEQCPVGDDWLAGALAHLPQDLRVGHYALLTSGSTGQPKLVIGRRSDTEALTRVIHARQGLQSVQATVLALPLTYSYAFVNQWLWARVHGAEVRSTLGLAQPRVLFEALRESGPSMLCLVGAQLPLLRSLLPAGERFAHVHRLNFAGGAFPQNELSWLAEVFPQAAVFNNYGCTEALPRLCIRAAADSQDPAWIGKPLDGVDLRVGPADALQFRSAYGAVAIAEGAGVRRLAEDAWIDTGDAGAQDGAGWRLLGRQAEVFKRYGEKVSLPELLATVRTCWSGGAAFYVEQSTGEPAHVLALAPAPDANQLRAILQAFRARHRRPLWPARIEALPALPLSANGKSDARALAADPSRSVAWRQIG